MSSIGVTFEHDYRRLEQTLESSMTHVRAGRWEATAAACAAFRRGIERHMEIEEQVLFPAVEGGAETPLTAILRKGHRSLRAFFDEINDAIEVRDAEEFTRIATSMKTLPERHDEREEAELYPAAQARLGADASAAAARLKD